MDYDVEEAFRKIENELLDSMMRNLRRHELEEKEMEFSWTAWQTEQLKALNEYKKNNGDRFTRKYADINEKIIQVIRKANENGMSGQEAKILDMLRRERNLKTVRKIQRKHQAEIPLTGQFFKLNERKLDALIHAAVSDMEKAEAAVLRRFEDEYRKVIFHAQVYGNTVQTV